MSTSRYKYIYLLDTFMHFVVTVAAATVRQFLILHVISLSTLFSNFVFSRYISLAVINMHMV
jgi:hypothetical protein